MLLSQYATVYVQPLWKGHDENKPVTGLECSSLPGSTQQFRLAEGICLWS